MRKDDYDSFPEATELKGLVVKAVTGWGAGGRAKRPDLQPNAHSREQTKQKQA